MVSWGPHNGKAVAPDVLTKTSTVNQTKRLFADVRYDAEGSHEFCREQYRVESIIKPAVHRSDGQPNGKYRSHMTEETLKDKNSGRHWLVESFMSRLKRTTGTVLPARTKQSLFVEAAIRVPAYTLPA